MSLSSMAGVLILLPACLASGQQSVTFPVPGGRGQISADLYGSGPNYVILAHGGRFAKESWKKQAEVLAASGLAALAIRFRGDAVYPDGSPNATGSTEDNAADVSAAVTYLHGRGATAVSAVGASLGGDAVGEADANLGPGKLARIVILASPGGSHPEKLNGRKLFIVARNDSNGSGPRLPGIRTNFERAREPKKLVIVDGSAHAQFVFDTQVGSRVMDEILRFLTEP